MPVSTSTGPDPDKPPGPSESALVPLARAEEDEMMEDVAEMAGGGQVSGQDALANLETTLRPVEKYAVRFLEEVSFAKISFAGLRYILLGAWMPYILQCVSQQQSAKLLPPSGRLAVQSFCCHLWQHNPMKVVLPSGHSVYFYIFFFKPYINPALVLLPSDSSALLFWTWSEHLQ